MAVLAQGGGAQLGELDPAPTFLALGLRGEEAAVDIGDLVVKAAAGRPAGPNATPANPLDRKANRWSRRADSNR